MELSFQGGRFVSSNDELNYKEVLNDFSNAKIIRIITYNISKNQNYDALLDALKNTNADIQLITNVPSRMEKYYDSEAGLRMRSAAKNNIRVYISKLNPENFHGQFIPFFNIKNHAKIIGTENIVYIGSANFSNESAYNIETGVLIEDKNFIQNLYKQFFDEVKNESLSYFDEIFSAFRLFVLSLYEKFKHHYNNIITGLYTDYERTELTVADNIFIDTNDLDRLYFDLDELKSVCVIADKTYDDKNEKYNSELEELKTYFEQINISTLQKMVSKGGTLYCLVAFDSKKTANYIIQTEYAFEADEENLNACVNKAMDRANEIHSSLCSEFEKDSEVFLKELENILSALEFAIKFTGEWKASKINPEIDNT